MLRAVRIFNVQSNLWRKSAVSALMCIFLGAAAGKAHADGSARAEQPVAISGPQAREPTKQIQPESEQAEAESRQALSHYSKRVDQLRSETDAYDNQFSEALLDLGLAQQQAGQHEEAIKTLKQAMHVNRINQGLYHTSAAPILERLIFSLASTGEWQAVDDSHHFLMQLSYQTLKPYDPELLPVLTKLSRWHLYAFMQNIDANPLKHLIAARGLFNRAASIIEINFGNSDLRLVHQYGGRTIADYYLAKYQQDDYADFRFSEEDGINRIDRKVVNIQQGFGEGLRAIQNSIAVYASNDEAPPEAEALALTQLGDWYLMFSKNQSAKRAYTESYHMLAANPEVAEVLDKTFGRPVPLPDFNNAYFDYFDDSEKEQELGYVLVNVDITAAGVPRRPVVLDASTEKKSVRRRALATLKATVFRPRYENGVAVATKDLRYRYRFETEPDQAANKDSEDD